MEKQLTRSDTDPLHRENGDAAQAGQTSSERSPTKKLQRAARWVILVGAVLGFGAGTGLSPIPHGEPSLAWWFHPPVILLGLIGGVLAIKRAREIDVERWIIVGEDLLTSGERAYAHKEAERQMRSAATVFLLASVAIGAWLAYQLGIPKSITVADLLVATPVIGFGIGLAVGHRRFPKVRPEL